MRAGSSAGAGFGAGVAVQIDKADLCALRGEVLDHTRADTRRAAGNEDDPPAAGDTDREFILTTVRKRYETGPIGIDTE